jgi:pimeloyl-ACP methyl ester carboxylesterase
VSLSPQTWARSYRALHPVFLSVQLVVLVLAEVALFSSYSAHDARFHWATHFLVGLGFTALLLLARLLVTGVPGPRYLLLTVLGFHLFAMAPDLLFRGGVPHYRWMDVFLGHVAAHYLPGGDGSWLLIALVATSAYVAALTLWLRARRSEALLGLPPGVGLTGMAVLRAQTDPRTAMLVHEEQGPAGSGESPVVLLHGLGASAAFWRPVATELAGHGVRTVSPDLLGFGSSFRLGTHFHLDDQAAAVVRLLEHDDHGPVVLVAHSYGAAVAVADAIDRPGLVGRLVLVAPAAFADADQARRRIGGRS